MSEVPTSARVLGAVGRGLITAGVVVLLFVVFQLWGTNLQEARAQDGLRDEFDGTLADAQSQLAALGSDEIPAGETDTEPGTQPSPVTSSTLPGGLTAEVLRYFFPEDGDAVARIEIPSIGVDKIVVSGVQVADLRKGPGQYPGTAAVGTTGNTSIAGHRTTYGAPFNRVDELAPGDEIHVTGILGRFTYRVMDPEIAYAEQITTVDEYDGGHVIVRPTATWVLGDFGDNRLTLTACHPELSSRQRIIVAAELVEAPADAPAFDPETIAALTDDGATIAGEDGTDTTSPSGSPSGSPTESSGDAVDAPARPAIADLDDGLDGEREAIPGAVLWMLAATTIWVIGGVLGRRYFTERLHRVAVRGVSLVPVAVCLWFSFEMIDRALPAG
ncbi:MAG: sortase [Acidimicrobiales bacterium]